MEEGMAAGSARPPEEASMMRELSANGESLGRRRFLGLGAGAAVFGSVSPSLSPGREEFILGGNSTPMSEYERRLSETRRMEVLGACPSIRTENPQILEDK
jgi:hypothetical protein